MKHTNEDRAEYIRLNEMEAYFCEQKSADVTIIALSLFIGRYATAILVPSYIIIGFSIAKLAILTICSMIEKKNGEYPVTSRTVQFWLYRVILAIQLVLMIWVIVEVTQYGKQV